MTIAILVFVGLAALTQIRIWQVRRLSGTPVDGMHPSEQATAFAANIILLSRMRTLFLMIAAVLAIIYWAI